MISKPSLSRYFPYILLFLLSGSTLLSQEATVRIAVTPDNFPQDIQWEIQDQYSEKIHRGSLTGCNPFETCEWVVTIDPTFCYSFIIRDRFGDGIDEPGGFQVFLDEELVIDNMDFGEKAYADLSCSRGESCAEAIDVILPVPRTKKIKAPKDKDYWFKMVPEEFGLYRISTCINLISGQGFPDTKMWIYDSCDRDLVREGAEGAIAISDDFVQCEPASAFYYFPLDGGVEYYIRHRRNEDRIDLDSVEIQFVKLPSVFGCTDPSSCNYNPYANIDDGSCLYDENCGPDLRLDEELLVESIHVDTVTSNDACLIEEGCLTGPGPREVVRFSTKIDNIGDTDYILGNPDQSPESFSKNNCHGHWHQEGYAEYLLYRGNGDPEPIGFKTGFCVLDLDCKGILPKYICSFMGITAGCSDIYSSEIECQWIDITDVEDGRYTLVVRVNWNRFPDSRGFEEKTFDNNWGQVCFSIDRSSGILKINLEDDCPEYTDCQGMTFGQAIQDCAGVCGGVSHYGDLDNTNELEDEDISIYMDMLEDNMDLSGACYDLNADGNISIYDAALAYECLESKGDLSTSNPNHRHCLFPGGFDNVAESVELRISNFDMVSQHIDVEVMIPDRNVTGWQLDFSGIKVSEVEKLYQDTADYFKYNDLSMFALHGGSEMNRSSEFVPLLRVHYSDITSDMICIQPSSEFINSAYERVNLNITESCIVITSQEELEFETSLFDLSPNPVSSELTIHLKTRDVGQIDVYTIEGRLVERIKNPKGELIEMSMEGFSDGLYSIRLVTNDDLSQVQKFLKISN